MWYTYIHVGKIFIYIKKSPLGVVTHAFKPSTWEEETGRCLIYIASLRIARAHSGTLSGVQNELRQEKMGSRKVGLI